MLQRQLRQRHLCIKIDNVRMNERCDDLLRTSIATLAQNLETGLGCERLRASDDAFGAIDDRSAACIGLKWQLWLIDLVPVYVRHQI